MIILIIKLAKWQEGLGLSMVFGLFLRKPMEFTGQQSAGSFKKNNQGQYANRFKWFLPDDIYIKSGGLIMMCFCILTLYKNGWIYSELCRRETDEKMHSKVIEKLKLDGLNIN